MKTSQKKGISDMTTNDVVNAIVELWQLISMAAYLAVFALGFIAGNQR